MQNAKCKKGEFRMTVVWPMDKMALRTVVQLFSDM